MSDVWNTIVQQINHSESTQLVAKVFGSWVYRAVGLTPPTNATDSTIVTLFTGQLATFVWVVFIGLFVYLSIASALHSAKEGTWVKREWSGMWGVIRLTMGMAAVVPVSKTGIVGACWLVMWLALVSSGCADLVWGNLLKVLGNESLEAQFKRLDNVLDENATRQLMDGAMSYVACCVDQINAADSKKVTLSGANAFNPIHPDPKSHLAKKIAKKCSSAKFQNYLSLTYNESPPTQPSPNTMDGGILAAYEKAQIDYTLRNATFDAIHGTVWSFYTNHFNTFQESNSESETFDAVNAEWEKDNTDFYNKIQLGIKDALQKDKTLETKYAKNVSQYGWVSAGNYYLQLAGEEEAISFAINAALQNSPNYVNPDDEQAFSDGDAVADVNTINALSWLQQTPSAKKSKSTKDPLHIELLKPSTSDDPILAMSRFGHSLEDMAMFAFANRGAVAALSWAPVAHGLNKVVNSEPVAAANDVIAVAGTMLGTVLPVIPTIFFAFCVISWFIYLLQMFIIAPFWLVANASPSGDGISSIHAKKGFNNALFVTCFPIFAIGGLTAAILVSRLGMWLVNAIFYQQFASMTGTMSMPLSFLALILLYALVAWSVMTNSMALVQSVPRTLLDWLSLSQPGMQSYDDAGNLLSGSMGKIGNMTASVTGRATQASSNMVGNPMRGLAKRVEAKMALAKAAAKESSSSRSKAPDHE